MHTAVLRTLYGPDGVGYVVGRFLSVFFSLSLTEVFADFGLGREERFREETVGGLNIEGFCYEENL